MTIVSNEKQTIARLHLEQVLNKHMFNKKFITYEVYCTVAEAIQRDILKCERNSDGSSSVAV